MVERARTDRTSLLTWSIAAFLMLWIVGAVTYAQWQMSPTYDEQNHVTRGIAILRTGDFRLCYHHPPLANILEGLPVAWARHGFSTSLPAWKQAADPRMIWPVAHQTIWRDPAQGIHLIRLARLPVLLFTLLLALIVFLWSRELFGPWGGVVSLALFALDPNLLAHSGLATTDMAAAATIVGAVYLLRRYLQHASRGRLLAAGAGVGLAFAAKFSALILFPVCTLMLVGHALRTWEGALPRVWRAVGTGLVMLVVAGVVLWATYGFAIEPFGSKPGGVVAASAPLIDHCPIPAMQFFRGIKAVMTEAESHPSFLFGHIDTSGRGWWYYFPVALAVKTPLPALVLILGALLCVMLPTLRRRVNVSRLDIALIFTPLGVYMMAATGLFGISLNLGLRHILPVLPLLYILAGVWASPHLVSRLPRYAAVMALLLVQGVSVLASLPNFLAYFNEIAVMHREGYQLLIDSNIDWGQDLAALAKLQRERRLSPLTVSYFGTTPPEAYGIAYTPAAGKGLMDEQPAPDFAHGTGYFAISVTNLMGGAGYSGVDYRPLLRTQPYARAGKTILIYRLPINVMSADTGAEIDSREEKYPVFLHEN